MKRVYIAIGSNKGDRVKNIKIGLKEIEKLLKIKKISSFFENPPVNAKGGFFLNGAIEGETNLSPEQLLEKLKDIEKKIGRKFPHKKGDAREIDFDIIFYEKRRIKTKKITIPHPKYRKRIFVLKPLSEINPDFVDPETKKKIKDIYMGIN
ncbi:MAG: 2-amino-4-hydroxy-6-hydroxymethyldihydropteridine diphosphokinase [Candidatus Omnitrophica bacterium]|nr:2-amino-4-hydroxy-6-hydroxymethyldihydropteridine diphosphokinase [Candidatus Omnitrophota bacterium]MCM8809121.1 2-amino-4-hydroxy-6-hydroxymethyldihydropteridine diphosphokinase [Candidatus Omnitrophota bacterium]MCM8811122.1 2-amino-4-hydroxy-6-hydroxymethyldihydropteridine diphosphokinase [Candidatus Omnitrophota bacterium]